MRKKNSFPTVKGSGGAHITMRAVESAIAWDRVASLPMPTIAAKVVASVLERVRVQQQAQFDVSSAYNGGRYLATYGDGGDA